ncbi:MAG: DsbA family oxidoreductase [Conexibacter sp.]
MEPLTVTEYTDPACPWAWSAEPSRWRLRWLYGDGLRWRLRMIGLTSDPSELAERGYSVERMADGFARFAERFGMPLDPTPRSRLAATVPACRAIVAARLHAPERERPLLRRLRVHAMTRPTSLLDEPLTLARAAREAGIEPAALERWAAEPEVERALLEDMAAARQPSPAGVALRHKLAEGPDGELRYAAPSLVFSRADGVSLDVPGFQPAQAYEVAVANLAPDLPRREPPSSAEDVLAWAPIPLATQEIATVMGVERGEAERSLLAAGGVPEAAGTDRFWSLVAAHSRAA